MSAYLGEIRIFLGSVAPAGWMFCNGQLLQIEQYRSLFLLLGANYGGDGNTTFALPDLRGRVPVHVGNGIVIGHSDGEATHMLAPSEVPAFAAHTHVMQATAAAPPAGLTSLVPGPTKAIAEAFATTTSGPVDVNTFGTGGLQSMSSAAVSTVGGQAHDNMMPSLVVNMIIAVQGAIPPTPVLPTPPVPPPNAPLHVFHQASAGGSLWDVVLSDTGSAWWTIDTMVPNTQPMSASPSAVFLSNKVYCFYQGPGNQLYYNVFDGTQWSGDAAVPHTEPMVGSPSAVVFTTYTTAPSSTRLYCFYQGTNGFLYYNVFDGTYWSGNAAVPHAEPMAGSPSAVVFNNTTSTPPTSTLYCFYRDNSNRLSYSATDGGNWSSSGDAFTLLSDSPSAVLFNKKIYCFHRGYSNGRENSLWYNVFDPAKPLGTQWGVDRALPGAGMSENPSAAVFNNQLYCFFQGSGDNNQFWYNVSNDGTNWLGNVQLYNTRLTGSPSAVVANFNNTNALYCFHPGLDGTQVWYNVFGGANWLADAAVPTTNLSESPSGVVFNNQLYCFHQSVTNNANVTQLWYNVFDGTKWAGDLPVPTTYMSKSPSAVVFNSQLYCFHQAVATGPNATQLCFTVSVDGANWSADMPILPTATMSESPSAVVFQGKLYCFYQSVANNQLWYSVLVGGTWTSVQVPSTQMSGSPVALVFGTNLYCFHQPVGNPNQLWCNTFNGATWSGDVQVPNTLMSNSPSAVLFNNQIYCFHRAANDDSLWYNVSGDGITWSGDVQVPATYMLASPSAVSVPALTAFPAPQPPLPLYLFYQRPSDGQLCYAVSGDGAQWSGEVRVPNTYLSQSPSAVVFNTKLYCFHQSVTSNANATQLWYDVFDGATWRGDQAMPATYMLNSPSAVVFGTNLYCFHQAVASGPNANQLCYNVSADGAQWSGDVAMVPTTYMSESPSAVVFRGTLYCFYQSVANNQLWYNVFDGGSGTWTSVQVPSTQMSGSPVAVVLRNRLYCFHQSAGNDHTLRCNVFDGVNWWGDVQVPGTLMSDSPSGVLFGDDLYCFHPGFGGNSPWYNVFHVAAWLGDRSVPNISMVASPSVVGVPQLTRFPPPPPLPVGLFVFHAGSNNDGSVWYGEWTDNNWQPDQVVPFTSISEGPAAVIFNNKLYCLHRGAAPALGLWYNVFDGARWVDDVQVPNTMMEGSPSAVVFQRQLYCFHRGSQDDHRVWYNVFDGTKWLGDTLVPNAATQGSPSAVAAFGLIWCFYRGVGDDTRLLYNTFNGNTWSDQYAVGDTLLSGSPSVVFYNDEIWCLHRGVNVTDTALWYSVYNNQTQWGDDEAVPDFTLMADPSAGVYNDQLWCFWGGITATPPPTPLYLVQYDGTTWTDRGIVSSYWTLPGVSIVANPSS